MATKYYIPFYDLDGNACQIDFGFADYIGDPIQLEGGANPLTISYNGTPDDLFQQIITSKASIVINYHEQFLNDTRDIDDKDVSVNIQYGNNLKWVGFLIADLRAETFDQTGYEVELTCVDPFSYLKGLQRDFLQETDIYGFVSLDTLIRELFKPIMGDIVIRLESDMVPTGKANLLTDTFLYSEVFSSDGLYGNGYDIMEELMTSFKLTAEFVNGILYLRDARTIKDYSVKQIGLSDRVNPEFLIHNSEQVTRTRGAKEVGYSFSYPETTSLFPNPNFYFYKNGAFSAWQTNTLPNYGLISADRIGYGRENSPYGVRLNGWNTTQGLPLSTYFMKVKSSYNLPNPAGISSNTAFNLNLKLKFNRYPVILDGDNNPLSLAYAFDVRLIKDSTYNPADTNTFMQLANNGSTAMQPVFDVDWADPSSSTLQYPRAYFKLENTANIQEFTCWVQNIANNPGFTGDDLSLEIRLWPLDKTINDGFIGLNGGLTGIPTSIDILSIDLFPVYNKESYNVQTGYDEYKKEETFRTNVKKYSLIDDAIQPKLNRTYAIRGYDEITLSDVKVLTRYYKGSLLKSDGSAIETFTRDITDGLISLNARDRMYFLRAPKNMIDLELRSSSLSFTDILEFPGVIQGKYVQLSDEYNVRQCEHHLNVMELSGSDSVTDIIENYLSGDE